MSSIDFSQTGTNKPIREIAYETLKHAIITGQIPAGSRMVETEYAEKLHISRTPLREALRKLERDGLVEYVLRRGVIVRAFTLADVEEIYTIRNALEMLTLPAIIENATKEDILSMREKLHEMDKYVDSEDSDALSPIARNFHDQLTAISGLNRILRVIQSQDEYIRRFSAISIAKEKRRKAAHEEHYLLVDYVEQKDIDKFTKLMQKHIEHSKQTCLLALSDSNFNK